MGIERIVPPAPRVRQPAVEQLSELAGSRAPPKMPQRQRGLWSFLTWPFLIAPIIAAESLLAGNSHALADQDQDDRSPDHGNGHPNATPDHDPAVAGSTHVADDAPRDGTDAMPHAVSFASKAFADANPAHEEHANAPGAHEAAAVPPVPPDDGGSGSIEPEATSSTETSTTSSSGGDTGTGLIGGDPGLGHTVTDVVSTVTGTVSTVVGGVSDVLAPVGSLIGSTVLAPVGDLVGSTVLTPVGSLIGSVDLKSLLGFDLHVNPNGEFVATDLDAVLDHGPLLPVADTVSHAVSPVVDALPMLGLGTSNPLDSLLGGNDHTSGAPLGPSLLGSGGGDDPTALVKGIVSSATPSLEKLADGLLPTPADGHSVLAPVASRRVRSGHPQPRWHHWLTNFGHARPFDRLPVAAAAGRRRAVSGQQLHRLSSGAADHRAIGSEQHRYSAGQCGKRRVRSGLARPCGFSRSQPATIISGRAAAAASGCLARSPRHRTR